MNLARSFFYLTLLTLSLAACSAKVDGSSSPLAMPALGDPSTPPAQKDAGQPSTAATPAPGPTPIPNPALTTAKIAASFDKAAFLFCSLQGSGVLVDLKGTNLATSTSGKVLLGYKDCNGGQKVDWETQPRPVQIQLISGAPQITFPGSEYGDKITPGGYQSGLAKGQAAYAEIGGNSGECFFLENEATRQIPFGFDCD